jgi:hypothetical protein
MQAPVPGKPAATPTTATSAPKPGASTTAPVTPERIVDVLANRAAYPVPLADASTRFASIATLTREAATPEAIIVAGSGPAVRRLEITYSKDASDHWIFSHVTARLVPSPPDDVPTLQAQLVAALRKKLGKPKFTNKGDDPLPQMGWKVKGPIELWVGEETSTIRGEDGPERHIRVSVAEPAGEAD